MSRFFFVKCDVMRDPWKCEMHWRDSAVTLVPRTPYRSPSLTPFLEAMHEELREFASAELGLCAELVGLMCLRRRATRVCQWGTGLLCRAGRAYVLSSGRHSRSSILDTMS
ncbi:hypothetical protein F511_37853 [Dorcoceras hygrometricum]|uniref:Uncharacterized protein n=1 Tax=Dorcoceras hygrometricum TaxID=472368 RepID=A0A2Z7BQK5_9LAMI|nr:hypothetical protein F511_37853 [Dorcoceras hygrometricum]